jgi:hypothetical protein
MGSKTYPTVFCASHGEQQETMVCQHVLDGLRSKSRVGFFWSQSDPENPRPDAWCGECNRRVAATDDGDWSGEALHLANPQVICGGCYDAAKIFHMGGDPWT